MTTVAELQAQVADLQNQLSISESKLATEQQKTSQLAFDKSQLLQQVDDLNSQAAIQAGVLLQAKADLLNTQSTLADTQTFLSDLQTKYNDDMAAEVLKFQTLTTYSQGQDVTIAALQQQAIQSQADYTSKLNLLDIRINDLQDNIGHLQFLYDSEHNPSFASIARGQFVVFNGHHEDIEFVESRRPWTAEKFANGLYVINTAQIADTAAFLKSKNYIALSF